MANSGHKTEKSQVCKLRENVNNFSAKCLPTSVICDKNIVENRVGWMIVGDGRPKAVKQSSLYD